MTISYILCVIYGLIFHNYAMHKAWEPLLPGSYWLSVGGFFIGLVESFLYGFYVALVFVPIYNFLCRRETGRQKGVVTLILVVIGGTFGFWIVEDHVTALLFLHMVILLGVGAALATIQTIFGAIVRKRIKEELKFPERKIEERTILSSAGMAWQAGLW